jgi:mannose-6-phosphate isomerase-like protein (cupin superfamily)
MDDRTLGAENVLLGPTEGPAVRIGGFGARFMIDAALTGGGFALVEHPLEARTLAGPMHTHAKEDEYSFILEGEVGMQVGDLVVTAHPGDLVYKPRSVPHAFWNATDRQARLLEIISPAGFERYFEEMAPLLNREGGPDVEALQQLQVKYSLEMDFSSIPALAERYGLKMQP